MVGADFLAARNNALLADAPRVGKTGTAILAADKINARRILVITTASGRAVWARAFGQWSKISRTVETLYEGTLSARHAAADVLIVGWAAVGKLLKAGFKGWDVLIVDESHYAKSVEAQRTKALYGHFNGQSRGWGLVDMANRVWCLTGTPVPNMPNDLYPMMRALCPDRMDGVMEYDTFLHRYCVTREKRVTPWVKITIPIKGRNVEELNARLEGFWLRRTQADVGITQPVYDILPIHISAAQRREIEASVEGAEDVLAAAETGTTDALEVNLGSLRRITGAPKAVGVANAVDDEMAGGMDKVVLMCWHRDVMDDLESRLRQHGVVRVDGSTSSTGRTAAVDRFSTDPETRVFIGQIAACGEAIDLSAAAELIFVESSWVPKDMIQAALRITNHTQAKRPRVRVAALEGSIDEALQEVLLRKMATIRETMK